MKHLIFSLILLPLTTAAYADLALDLRFDDSSVSKTVTSGDTVFIDMFLRDTDNSTPMQLEGLSSGGGRILQSSGTAILTDNVATIAGGAWNQLLSTASVAGGPSTEVSSIFVAPPFPLPPLPPFPTPPVGIGSTIIHLARFSVMVSGLAGEMATITSDVLGSGNTGNVTGGGTDLDLLLSPLPPSIPGPGVEFTSVSITVGAAAVPEASTFVVAILLAAGFVYIRRHKQGASDVI